MKIRQDFVSNSSSCSFVIGDAETIWSENTLAVDRTDIMKMIDVIKQIFNENDNIPYDLDVSVRIYARNKNFAVLETALTGETDYRDTFEDYRTHEIIIKDPESFGFDTINVNLSRFINTILTLDDKTCDMIEAITFDCDDYERSKCDMKFPCNIHVVLSKDTFPHVMSVLKDAADKKIDNLGAIVMLRMKNVGRAKNLDPHIPDSMYEEVVNFCLEHDVKFGFDSCGCHRVEDVLRKIGREDLISSIEPCESSRFSGYWNVKSQYYNCSFCEQLQDHAAIDPYKYRTFTEFWHSKEVEDLRNPLDGWACKSCPFMNLD